MEDPQTLMLIRGGYILSNVLIISIYAYVHFLINKKKGKRLHYFESLCRAWLTVLLQI
jgi:hypothetical protein